MAQLLLDRDVNKNSRDNNVGVRDDGCTRQACQICDSPRGSGTTALLFQLQQLTQRICWHHTELCLLCWLI